MARRSERSLLGLTRLAAILLFVAAMLGAAVSVAELIDRFARTAGATSNVEVPIRPPEWSWRDRTRTEAVGPIPALVLPELPALEKLQIRDEGVRDPLPSNLFAAVPASNQTQASLVELPAAPPSDLSLFVAQLTLQVNARELALVQVDAVADLVRREQLQVNARELTLVQVPRIVAIDGPGPRPEVLPESLPNRDGKYNGKMLASTTIIARDGRGRYRDGRRRLNVDQPVLILDSSGDWVKVKWDINGERGQVGWVDAKIVQALR